MEKNKRRKTNDNKTNNSIVDIPPLPEDIILEILSRLPAKSLSRFQSVCKNWYATIHSPSFADLHLINSQTQPCGVPQILVSFPGSDRKHYFNSASLEGGPAVRLLSLPGCKKPKMPCQCYVSESLNGLVCFYNGRKVYVINPSTRRFKILPSSEYDPPISDYDITTMNNPSKYYSCYSFGYDPSKNEYKVLHILGWHHNSTMRLSNMQCEVFTIKPKLLFNSHDDDNNNIESWRKITYGPPYTCMFREEGFPCLFREQGVCVGGAIYWISCKAPGEEVVVAFYVGSENFRTFPLPDGVSGKHKLRKIGGRLALFSYSDKKIWILEDCHDMWFQKTVVAPPEYEILFTFPKLSLNKKIYWDHSYKTSKPIISIGEKPFYYIRGAGFNYHYHNGVNVSITNHVESIVCLS